jgi:hypothetical protein
MTTCEFSENTQSAEVSFDAPKSEDSSGIRKDLAVCASLSSNQIVKDPAILSETGKPPSRSISSFGRNR